MSLFDSYKRWRHTRGYGVHSPYAFSLVTNVIRPGADYAYYGYDDIDNALTRDCLSSARRHARMLLRLAAFLNVTSAFMPNDRNTKPFRAALRAVSSKMRISTALSDAYKCNLILSIADYIPLDTLCNLITTTGRVIALREVPEGWTDVISDALPHGVMLFSKNELIVINRENMQKVSYSMRL